MEEMILFSSFAHLVGNADEWRFAIHLLKRRTRHWVS
jgi:hypothetical protein